MADSTTVTGIPFPEGPDANDVPADMQALAERVDEVPGIESLTSAQISALTAGQKPAGRVVYNSTTSKLQVSNGTTFADVDAAALLKAGGTMSGAIAMGGTNKITGLAAADANGDAVRYEQLTAKLDSARVVSGVWSGTTDASGDATITLPTSPTGNWAVTLTAKPDSYSDWSMVTVKATTATSVTFRLWRWSTVAPQAASSSSSYDVHYIAVAY